MIFLMLHSNPHNSRSPTIFRHLCVTNRFKQRQRDVKGSLLVPFDIRQRCGKLLLVRYLAQVSTSMLSGPATSVTIMLLATSPVRLKKRRAMCFVFVVPHGAKAWVKWHLTRILSNCAPKNILDRYAVSNGYCTVNFWVKEPKRIGAPPQKVSIKSVVERRLSGLPRRLWTHDPLVLHIGCSAEKRLLRSLI